MTLINNFGSIEDYYVHLQTDEAVDLFLWRNYFWPAILKNKKITDIYLGEQALHDLKKSLFGKEKLHLAKILLEQELLWGAKISRAQRDSRTRRIYFVCTEI